MYSPNSKLETGDGGDRGRWRQGMETGDGDRGWRQGVETGDGGLS